MGYFQGYCESNSERLSILNVLAESSIVQLDLPVKAPGTDPNNRVLAPNETIRLPMWLRGDRIGKHHFRFLFHYQSEVPVWGTCRTACVSIQFAHAIGSRKRTGC
jgi:hypothetical protein